MSDEKTVEEVEAEETEEVSEFDAPLYTGHDEGHVLHDSGE